MKAIKTQYHGPTERRGSRISASTGEKGQRIYLKEWGSLSVEQGQALAACTLCEKMGWSTDLIGGGFPDGSMVWVFATSHARTVKRYKVKVRARRVGALGVQDQHREFWVNAVAPPEARSLAIEAACCQQLEHVDIISVQEQPL